MKNNLILNPLYFFSLGFVYYLISPFLAFLFINDFFQFTPLEASLPYINIDFFNIYYFIDLIVIYFSFLLGYKIASLIKINKDFNWRDEYSKDKNFHLYIFIIITALLIFLIFNFLANGNVFFSGYKEFNIKFLGQVSTLTVITMFFFNFTTIKKNKILFLSLLMIEFILLLSLGSRNIVTNAIISLILSLLFYKSYLVYKLKFYMLVTSCIVLILYIGVWRTGYELKVQTLIGIFFAEPMFVLTSASVYLNEVGREIYNIPYELFLAIVNFIPTFLYEDKVELIKSYISFKYNYSPFGASSIFINMYSNFGYLYFLYIMFIGFYFNILYIKAKESIFYRSIYFLVVPLLIFQFYNQFLFSFFKLFLWNGLLLPMLIVYLYSKIKN